MIGRQKGFTLLELLIASTVFSLLMVGTFTLFATNSRVFSRGQSQAETQQNARIAADRIARETRVAGYDLSGVMDTLSSPTPVQVAQQNQLAIVADVDLDGTLDRVQYQVLGSTVLRSHSVWNGSAFGTATTSEVADGLTSLAFSYFDVNDTPMTAPVSTSDLDDIHRITIAVVTEATTVGETDTFPLVVDVRLRNK